MSELTREELLALGCGTYLDARQLSDGSWAVLAKLIYTWSIQIGVTADSPFETRYCYDDLEMAENEFAQIEARHDIPHGWVAKRPQ